MSDLRDESIQSLSSQKEYCQSYALVALGSYSGVIPLSNIHLLNLCLIKPLVSLIK